MVRDLSFCQFFGDGRVCDVCEDNQRVRDIRRLKRRKHIYPFDSTSLFEPVLVDRLISVRNLGPRD